MTNAARRVAKATWSFTSPFNRCEKKALGDRPDVAVALAVHPRGCAVFRDGVGVVEPRIDAAGLGPQRTDPEPVKDVRSSAVTGRSTFRRRT